MTEHHDFDNIKVGDVIHMKDSSTGYEHTVLVTDVSRLSEGIFNCAEGNSNKVVRWGSGYDSDQYNDSESYIYSRY